MVSTGNDGDRFVEATDAVALGCASCGEKLLLLGREEDWYAEGRTEFGCGRCGSVLTLADRSYDDRRQTPGISGRDADDEGVYYDVRELLRHFRSPSRSKQAKA